MIESFQAQNLTVTSGLGTVPIYRHRPVSNAATLAPVATVAAASQVCRPSSISLRGGGSGARGGSSVEGGTVRLFIFFRYRCFIPYARAKVLFLRVMGRNCVGSLVGTHEVHPGYVGGGKRLSRGPFEPRLFDRHWRDGRCSSPTVAC